MTDKYAGHTPGPWGIAKDREGVMTILIRYPDGNPKKHIAVMSWADTEGGQPDAELIADAPSLLKALKQIEGKAELACDILGPDANQYRSWLMIKEMCRAALNSDAPLSVGEGL